MAGMRDLTSRNMTVRLIELKALEKSTRSVYQSSGGMLGFPWTYITE